MDALERRRGRNVPTWYATLLWAGLAGLIAAAPEDGAMVVQHAAP